MKFLYTVLFLFIISLISFGQKETNKVFERENGLDIDIIFTPEPYSTKLVQNKSVIEFYNSIDEGFPGAPILPSKTYFVAIPPSSKIKVQLIDQKYNLITSAEIALNPDVTLSTDSILIYQESKPDLSKFVADQFPSNEVEIIDYTWLRDYYCAFIKVNTHTYNWKKSEIRELLSAKIKIDFEEVSSYNPSQKVTGEFDKVLDKIILNVKQASQFRANRIDSYPADSLSSWIDYSREYVNLQIPDDGIYRIDYNQVIEYGINPQSINPKTIKLFSKGKEIPIYVSGENDLSFDPADYIEFWSKRNYGSEDYRDIVSIGEDYINYFNRYSDTATVWLSWDGMEGKRVFIQNSITPGLTDTLLTHKVFIHQEEDARLWYYDAVSPRVQLPNWQENKVWTWHFLGNGGSIDFNFTANDFVLGTSVDVIARMISNATDQLFTNNHRFGLSLNSTSPLDTIVFNYKQTVNFPADYNSNQLIAGNNTIRIFGMQNDSLRWHQALIDWVDIEYQRYNVATNDSLLIRVDDNTFTAERVVKVSNITQQPGNMSVYKIKPSFNKITSFNITNSVLTFTDTVAANDEYIIIKQNLANAPIFQKKKYFVNLRDSNRGADYIVITNRVLQSSAEQYINFINSNYETRNELIYVDDIYDEFSFGYAKPEAIKDFLYYANQNWIAPSPSYLLLLGEANYDYKNKITPPPTIVRKNLVPSYGNPVSDVWFTMWDTSNVNLPQMFVGRVPATTNEEVYFYLSKHQTYLNRMFDDFNKRYLFLSGGDSDIPGQIELLKSANNSVLNNIVQPAPIGGQGIHFYKTVDPLSNFGPYTTEQIENAIDSSGLFVSYIGHSGTESWDNGVTDVHDLKPAFSDRLSVISDFGCSTGKFAEPDVDAFGELFISASNDGHAINYLGNASWGYVSTSVTFPQLFYEQLLLDSSLVVSKAHFLAKMKLLNQYGTGDVNRVFNYCNVLFGDPLISFKLPPKPNLVIESSFFALFDPFPLDSDDSVSVKILFMNFGNVTIDSVEIQIFDNYAGNQSFYREIKIPIPFYRKEIILNIPSLGLVGQHTLSVVIDPMNEIDEIFEDDNSAEYSFIVYSSSVRPIKEERFYNLAQAQLKFLNPVITSNKNISSILIEISDNPYFNNVVETQVSMDTVTTNYNIPSLSNNERYWWRARLNYPQSNWSDPYSLFNENFNFNWYFNHSFNQSDIQVRNIAFDSTSKSWKLTKHENLLEIGSAGYNDGSYGSIKLNNLELLPNTYYWGIATAIIDSITLQPSEFKYFLDDFVTAGPELASYIDTIPSGTMLALTICTDGAQSVLGWSAGTPVRQAIESLGSLYIDSVFYRDSWCMIGKKGAPQGTVPESFSQSSSGPAFIDTSVIISNLEGWLELPKIKNAAEWLSATKTDSLPTGSDLKFIPLGIKYDNSIDTLEAIQFTNNLGDISSINADIYPSIKLLSRFRVNGNYESPVFRNIGVGFIPVPELAINYQVVSPTADSVLIGEDIGLSFYVYNVGESKTDSFNVKVEVINEDNSRETIFSQRVDSLSSDERKYFEIVHNTVSGSGEKAFLINIDSDDQIRELFEDNNFFSIPFFIKPDTSKPLLTLTIDGNDILDGEYVAHNPLIHIELTDQSLLPITDPGSVMVYLNEVLIPGDTSIINYQFSESNPKVTVDFTPLLADGEYNLKVIWTDYEGNIVDSSGVEKFFLVSNEAKILDVYNYPNPTTGETHFTFKLTKIPEEIRIKIFTIAGRLVKEINLTASELKYDFNKIYWDGRDEDNDLLGNGVYLYKVIMQAGEMTEEVTQKLAVVK